MDEIYTAFFPIGAAVSGSLKGFNSFSTYSRSVMGVFNSLTAENEMNPEVMHPYNTGTAADFNWAPADAIVEYARSENLFVRGSHDQGFETD